MDLKLTAQFFSILHMNVYERAHTLFKHITSDKRADRRERGSGQLQSQSFWLLHYATFDSLSLSQSIEKHQFLRFNAVQCNTCIPSVQIVIEEELNERTKLEKINTYASNRMWRCRPLQQSLMDKNHDMLNGECGSVGTFIFVKIRHKHEQVCTMAAIADF